MAERKAQDIVDQAKVEANKIVEHSHDTAKETGEQIKEKAKKALKKIIDNCSHLSALEPLLIVAPEKILKHILNQYCSHLKGNTLEKKIFVQNGGLHKLQELKSRVSPALKDKINEINGFYPEEIVKYYSPDYAKQLLNKIETYQD